MKKFISRTTGELVYGKFGQATKPIRKRGYDWQLVQENGSKLLFISLEEFIEKYEEELNPNYIEFKQIVDQFFEIHARF